MAIPQNDLYSGSQSITPLTSSHSKISLSAIKQDQPQHLSPKIEIAAPPYLNSTSYPVIFTSPPSNPNGPKPVCVLSTTNAQSTVSSKTLERFYPELVRISSTSSSPNHTISNQDLDTLPLPLSGGKIWYLITALSGLMGKLSWLIGLHGHTGTGNEGKCTTKVKKEYVSLPIIVADQVGQDVKFWIRARVVESEKEGICIGWGDLRKQGMSLYLGTPQFQIRGTERKARGEEGNIGFGKVLLNADRYGNVIADRENEKGNWLICGERKIAVDIVQMNVP